LLCFIAGKLGRFPPRMHYQAAPDSRAAPPFPRSHLAEAVAKAKAGGGGGSAGGTGRGLVGQIIPIYGFGIFLYILYILFKVRKLKIIEKSRMCQVKILKTEMLVPFPYQVSSWP